MVFINASTSLVSCGVIVFQCLPIKASFYPLMITAPGSQVRCLDSYDVAISIPSTNLGLDIAVALLPVRMILSISLPGKSKAMILVMLGLGALYVIIPSPPPSLGCWVFLIIIFSIEVHA